MKLLHIKKNNRMNKAIRVVGLLTMLVVCFKINNHDSKVLAATSTTTTVKVTSIDATYKGDNVIVGNDISTSDVTVEATYSDGTVATITDFTLSTKKVTRTGENTIVVVYSGKTAKIYVTGISVDSISANYSGDSIVVGNEIDLSFVEVEATYTDGSTVSVDEFSLPTTKVTKEGTNTLKVVYGGKTTEIYVTGIKVESISAEYTGDEISIGNSSDPRNLIVTATYSDGSDVILNSTDYKVYNNVVTSTGTKKAYVMYEGHKAEFTIDGKSSKSITSISATYSGSGVSIGTAVNPVDLYVVAVYKDGETEVINNYSLNPSTIDVEGTITVTVTYRGKTATVNITGIPEVITSIDATYIGESVVVGSAVRSQDVKVTATYEDGSKKVITDFNILGANLTLTGSRTVTIEAGGCKDDIIVLCVASKVVDYSNAAEFDITNGYYTGHVYVDLTSTADKTKVIGTSLEKKTVVNLMRRAWKGCSFIAFEISLDDPDLIEEFPLTIKIKLPSKYVAAKTKLFYTTNLKSVIGEMTPTVESTSEISCIINNTGTYIVAYKAE